MNTIPVSLGKNSYEIHTQLGLSNTLSILLDPLNNHQKWVLFTQEDILQIYGNKILSQLKSANFDIYQIILKDGEDAKSLSALENIYTALVEMGCDRNSTFIALGGGVVGDVTGFIAATFMRGVDYIQIPTTLLGMVDSSIGGKTGVNLNSGKNLVGAIWQPKAVYIDPQFLNSLPKREVISAIGEILKYGAILDKKFLIYLSEILGKLLILEDSLCLEKVIQRCAKLKAEVVSKDETENNLRRILNFGHTIGHALEKYFGFEVLRHGEAISYGMLATVELSVKYSSLSQEDYNLITNTIKKLPLPPLPQFDAKELYEILCRDKKVYHGKVNFVLLSELGKTQIVDSIVRDDILEAMNNLTNRG